MPTAAPIIVKVQDRAYRDQQLEKAVDLLKQRATDCGILITRHSFGKFTAKLSPDVQYGFIQERDLL